MNLEEKKEQILEVARNWYLGLDTDSPMSDLEFDALENEILKEDPAWDYRDHLNLQGETKTHYVDMTKVNKFQETERGMDEVFKDLRTKKGLISNPKLDGGGLILYYKKGKLYDALTRSSQKDGKRQYDKVKTMVPTVIENKKIVAIECEAVVDLKHGFGDLSRQKATGLLNSNSLQEECEKYLTIAAFKVRYEEENLMAKKAKDLSDLPTLMNGNNITFHPIPLNEGTYQGNKYTCKHLGTHDVTYLIDGIVAHFDPYSAIHDEYLANKKIKSGRDAVAHKLYFNEKKFSTITDIEWNLHIGALKYVPKYKYNTVNVDGTNCSAATAGGTAQLFKMKCGIGAEVEIIKAGLTIPQVLRPVSLTQNFGYEVVMKDLTMISPEVDKLMESIKDTVESNSHEVSTSSDMISGNIVSKIAYKTDGYTHLKIKKEIETMIDEFTHDHVKVEGHCYIEPEFRTSENYGFPVKCGCGTEMTVEHDLNGGLYCPNEECSVYETQLKLDLFNMETTLVDLIKEDPIKFVTAFLKCPRFGGEKKLGSNKSVLLKSDINSRGKCVNTYAKYTIEDYVDALLNSEMTPVQVTEKHFDLSKIQIQVMNKFDNVVNKILREELKG